MINCFYLLRTAEGYRFKFKRYLELRRTSCQEKSAIKKLHRINNYLAPWGGIMRWHKDHGLQLQQDEAHIWVPFFSSCVFLDKSLYLPKTQLPYL